MRDSKYFDLLPTNGRKSFYGKAKVHTYVNDANNVKSELLSYDTKVAVYNDTNNEITFLCKEGDLSNTTLTHINTFLECYGFTRKTKKEILTQL